MSFEAGRETRKMWSWFTEHGPTIGVAAQVLTLVVWVLYFQILLSSLRHRVRPKILINRGGGRSLSARCIIANMSAEPIYVEALIVALGHSSNSPEYTVSCSLSDLDLDFQSSEARDHRASWYQGPLQSADYLEVGSFQSLVARACDCRRSEVDRKVELADVRRFKLTVLATYTAGKRIVAAEKEFEIDATHPNMIHSRSLTTRQITSLSRRRRLVRLLES